MFNLKVILNFPDKRHSNEARELLQRKYIRRYHVIFILKKLRNNMEYWNINQTNTSITMEKNQVRFVN